MISWRPLRDSGGPVVSNRPIARKHPAAPKPVVLSFGQRVAGWCHWGVANQRHFSYTQTARRSELFACKPGVIPATVHADCSQFVATVLHWLGVKIVNNRDYTGTLLQKGRPLREAKLGAVVVWGGGTGEHTAFISGKEAGQWLTTGFGHSPGAPNVVRLVDMTAYFAKTGHPGVRFLDFEGL